MAKIEREIKHSLGLDGAKAAVSTLADKLQEKFGSLVSEIKWNDDKTAADIKGKGFTGKLNVSDADVKIVMELGLLTSPFKGRIEEEIDNYTKDLNV